MDVSSNLTKKVCSNSAFVFASSTLLSKIIISWVFCLAYVSLLHEIAVYIGTYFRYLIASIQAMSIFRILSRPYFGSLNQSGLNGAGREGSGPPSSVPPSRGRTLSASTWRVGITGEVDSFFKENLKTIHD